jgi:hypothetical protein
MSGKGIMARDGRRGGWVAGVAFLAIFVAGSASAQTAKPQDPAPTAENAAAAAIGEPMVDPKVTPASCAACGGGLGGGGCGDGGCGSGCCGNCYPGRKPCDCCFNTDTCCGRLLEGLYECVCCPDPCYEPHWCALADAAFFVDAPRPKTQMRLRYDAGWDLDHPDRAEFFWAKQNTKNLIGPASPCAPSTNPGNGPACVASSVNYEDLSLYMEGAADRVGIFVEMPYREVDPTAAPITSLVEDNANGCCPHSGFADMTVGTKTLLLDCELLQISFQFKTFIPVGNAMKGLGTNHVSLEPALLMALRLGPNSYLQAETAYWIPISGDPLYMGDVFHAHASFNHILWRPCCDIQLIGTIEANEWSVLGGNYTAEWVITDAKGVNNAVALSGTATIASAGPGIRLNVCDRIDFGVGTAFSFTGARWAEELIRSEFRWRF